VAFVVARPSAAVDRAGVTAWANERLARFQRIADLVVLAEFPRNTLGKVLKTELRDGYRAARSGGG
jgi:malonyl-CoA/methylmalonyl-CoA synthetase